MPRQAPTQGERFNIAQLHTSGDITFRDSNGQNWEWNIPSIHTQIADGAESAFVLNRLHWLRDFREAGMWFADIAHILQYPSASSCSAAYVRYCREIGVQPLVRAENRRANRIAEDIREASAEQRPEFLNRIIGGVVNGTDDFGFGVEIEQVGLSRRDLVNITSDLGLPTNEDLSYTHGQPHLWKAVPDGSLRGRTTGELVSRILKGHDGLVELRNVLLKLKQQGSKTNASCGQHIHIGIERFGLQTQAMVIRNHAIFQHVFDLLVNPLRRNHRDYARHTEWETAMQNADHFQDGNQGYCSMQKYRSLNINKYSEYGTFEFRAFHGSLNPRHTVAWLQLHFDFFTFCQKVSKYTRTGRMSQRLAFRESTEMQDLAARMPLTMKYVVGLTATDPSEAMPAAPWVMETGVGVSGFNDSPFAWQNRGAEWQAAHPIGQHSQYQKTVAHNDIEPNQLAQWALPILQEWVSDQSFIGNPTVRQVIKELALKQFPMLNPTDLTVRA